MVVKKNNSSQSKSDKNKSNNKQRQRQTIDDPENDIFDDETFEEDSIVPKNKPTETNFEKPW